MNAWQIKVVQWFVKLWFCVVNHKSLKESEFTPLIDISHLIENGVDYGYLSEHYELYSRLQYIVLEDNLFSLSLYRTFNTEFNNLSEFCITLDRVNYIIQTSLVDVNEAVYIDDPLVIRVGQMVKTISLANYFVISNRAITPYQAFRILNFKLERLFTLYLKMLNHPHLADYRKEYVNRKLSTLFTELSNLLLLLLTLEETND